MKKIIYLLLVFAFANSSLFAYSNLPSNVIPPTYAMTNGTAAFTGPIASTPRTYQQLINQSLLSNLVGSLITGITWRLPSNATGDWPASEIVFSSYDVYLSGSVPPDQRSLTFALNVVGTQTQVRSGSWTVPLGSFRSGGSPNDFGHVVNFTTPYLYTGGHLLIEIRHTGHSATSRSNDGIGTSTTGYGTDFSACWGSGNTATSGSQGNFSVLNIITLASNIGTDPSNLPANYQLSQNFPNPFNPTTDIKFEIPNNEFVTLKVYDKLGREVQTLVNEFKQAGSYKVSFNASTLSSGIYFYKIQSGSFSETKKMMLIK